jgi:ubiquinone/menaquinone biosynthesis C-methylase UbiE
MLQPANETVHPHPRPDLAAAKARQRIAWNAGDYAVIGTTLQIVGELLCEAVDLRAGQRVLDVAAGNGNATLAAARRFTQVTAVDYIPALLDRARERAEAERVTIEFREGDAEALEFEDASFDVVLSTFGVMFTPDQEQAAREILRVCRPGGRVGLANWTPEGFIGRIFQLIGRWAPPAPGLRPPSAWGTESRIAELFGAGATKISTTRREFTFRYASAAHWIDVFRTYYGPMHKAFAALDPERQEAMERELSSLLLSADISAGESLVIPAEYLEVVIERA